MRIDLIFDFHEILKDYFLEFIKKNKKRNYENNSTLSMDFIHFRGESIFKGALYFCSYKSYYSLKPIVFDQVENKDCIIFRRHYKEWEPCVDIHDKTLIRELSKRYDYIELDTIRLIDHSFIRTQNIQFYIGFCVDRREGHQVFYIWSYRIGITELSRENKTTLEEEKIKILAYHKLFIEYVKKRKKAGETATVNDFYKSNIINRKTFQKQFKEYVGTTFYDYHLQLRQLKALKLLLATHKPIKSISIKVGCDSSVLSKAFRQKQFLPPSKYRNSHFFK